MIPLLEEQEFDEIDTDPVPSKKVLIKKPGTLTKKCL